MCPEKSELPRLSTTQITNEVAFCQGENTEPLNHLFIFPTNPPLITTPIAIA